MARTIFIFILFFAMIIFDNQDKVIRLAGIPEIFTTDKLGNFYVYRDNQLIKFSEEGDKVGQYTSFESGPVFSIDASDPMQVMLFYKDFNQLVFLDNKLNPLGKPIVLDLIDFSSVSAACKSRQFALWIYDEYEHKLIHYRFNPKGIIQSVNLDKLGKKIGSVDLMVESGNEIYLKEKNKNIWIFDHFGGILNKLDITPSAGFQIRNDMLIYDNHKKVYLYNLKSGNLDSIGIGKYQYFDHARIENNQVYILNSDSVSISAYEK